VETNVLVKPTTDFNNNTTYILKLDASVITDIAGNKMDNDGDNIPGESPDDDRTERFVTIKSDGSIGEFKVPPDDKNPARITGMYYLDGDSVVTKVTSDISIAVNIIDSTYKDTVGFPIITRGVNGATVNINTIILREKQSGTLVPGNVGYFSSPITDPKFGRAKFNPSGSLTKGLWYKFEVYGSIADAAGNKLEPTSTIAYEATFCYVSDINFPNVTTFDSNPTDPYFVVTFDKEMNPSTITGATITLTDNGDLIPGVIEIGRIVDATGIKTTVIFAPTDGASYPGATVWISRTVKDTGGYMMHYDYYDTW